MNRVARNYDVSRQTANHNVIIRLDNEILFLRGFFSHMGGVVVEREEPGSLWVGGQFSMGGSQYLMSGATQPATCRLLHVVLLTYRHRLA